MSLNFALTIDKQRVIDELTQLAGFSDAPSPAVTRILFTDADMQGRAYLKDLFLEAGLSVRQDAIGNIFARWEGTNPELGTIGTGSHTDAIPFSGMYDGTVGVVGAIEAFRALKRAGYVPKRSLEILMFTSEEPTRFGIGCLGSRVLSGAWTPSAAGQLKDAEGLTVEEVRIAAGCEGSLESVRLPDGYYDAFVELHIEQGPLLEADGQQIGAVTAIAAPATLRVELEGVGGHAGVVLMPQRRDAMVAGAELSLAVEAAALATGSLDTVATTGLFQVHPGAVNSVPSHVLMEIDVRDSDLTRRDSVVSVIRKATTEICERRKIICKIDVLNADPPAQSAPQIVEAVQNACDELKYSCRSMVSRAYHDSLFMARIAPTGMIFIPCRDGVSHRPDEYSSPEEIERGVATLALTMAELSEG